MKNRKILLFLFLILFLFSCGKNHNVVKKNPEEKGFLSLRLEWAKKINQKYAAPPDVTTVRITISAEDMTPITKDFPASSGGGIISDIPAGENRTIVAFGLDSAGNIKYQGSLTGVKIVANQTTEVVIVLFLSTSNKPPFVTLSVNPSYGYIPLTVTFTIKYTDPEGNPGSYLLNYGDGTTPAKGDINSGETVKETHVYSSAGNYIPIVVATDDKETAGVGMAEVIAISPVQEKWQKTYGKPEGSDGAYSIIKTPDGGYILAGYTYSSEKMKDVYVIKIDSSGEVKWEKTYGGENDEEAYCGSQTSDGGYILAGYTGSSDNSDVYILKIDANGVKKWEKIYKRDGKEIAYSISPTSDGGYILAGYTSSSGNSDIYIIKIDANGGKKWEKIYERDGDEKAYSISSTKDGGYIIAGETDSLSGTGSDVYIIKIDANGGKKWEKIYGRDGYDSARSILQAPDGGYIVAGSSSSSLGASTDFYIIKLTSTGEKEWEEIYGGVQSEEAYSISQTPDGGYIVAGWTYSFGRGFSDFYIIKLNSSGKKIWERIYGGEQGEFAYSILQTPDGGYIVAGETDSFGVGYSDVYVIKMDAEGDAGDYPQKSKKSGKNLFPFTKRGNSSR